MDYVHATPTLLFATGTVDDLDTAAFAGGSLIVSVTTKKQGTDRVSIQPGGDITVTGNEVRYQGDVIGTFAGTNRLIVTLNENATHEATTALLQRITFHSVSATPSALARTATVQLKDGARGTSQTHAKQILFV